MLITVIKSYFQAVPQCRYLTNGLAMLQFLALFFSLFVLAYLLNKVLLVPSSKKLNFGLLILTILAYLLSVVEQFIPVVSIDEFFDIVMFIYYFAVFIRYRRNVLNENLKRVMRFTFIITVLFIPGIILDEIIASQGVNLVIVPIFFIFVGVYSVIAFNKVSDSIQNKKYSISKSFIEKYGITERETEVILLLLKGLSYNKIAGELVISISTVRTHVTNIYKKTSVNSRYELYNLID
jgi:DNA-binding CsgD family transcriptional regulator